MRVGLSCSEERVLFFFIFHFKLLEVGHLPQIYIFFIFLMCNLKSCLRVTLNIW